VESRWLNDKRLFVSLLNAADKKTLSLLLQHWFNPSLFRIFRK
jgi:hypothetical protein